MYTLVSPVPEPLSAIRPYHLIFSFFLLLFSLLCIVIFSGIADPTSTQSPVRSSSFSALSSSPSSSSSSLSLPLYTAVIDAGSTGSRIYLYQHGWVRGRVIVSIARDSSGSPIERKLEPGLSFYAATGNFSAAAASLDPLLSFISTELEAKGSAIVSPVSLFVYATAGLRFLPIAVQQATVEAIVSRVAARFPLLSLSSSNARVITGKEEGLFAWLALNYALDTLNQPTHSLSSNAAATAGLVELGGASVQVAFEMTSGLKATLEVEEQEGQDRMLLHNDSIPPEYAATVHLHLRCSSLSAQPSPIADDKDERGNEDLQPSNTTPSTLSDDGSSTYHLYVTTSESIHHQ